MSRLGGRWRVGPLRGYANPSGVVPEPRPPLSTSETGHSSLQSRLWCPWPGCCPAWQGTEVSPEAMETLAG